MEERLNIRGTDTDWESDVEQELVDSSIGLMEKPFDPTKINIETKTPSLDTLINRIQSNSVAMNTEEYFQRKDDLWDVVKQSRLIESILIRFPLPAFFFDATKESHWLIVDGLQRLSSIRNFCVKKTLKLTNLEFLTQLEGLGWDDLQEDLQRLIKETQVVIYKIMPGTPTDVKFNIFKRINTGGLILAPQEIRHALFQGTPAIFISELAQNTSFIRATGGTINAHRMLDRDFANRFLAFYIYGHEEYQPDLDTFMSKAMAVLNTMDRDRLDAIKDDFTKAMDLAFSIFKDEAFRKVKGPYQRKPPINKALFDAIAAQFARISDSERSILQRRGSAFKKSLEEKLATDDKFFGSVTSSTGDKGQVKYRHGEILTLIQLYTVES